MLSSFQIEKRRRKQKRNRISLSCSNCKKRKVKCDRGNPCKACIKYHGICEYPNSIWTTTNQDDTGETYQIHGFDATRQPPPQSQVSPSLSTITTATSPTPPSSESARTIQSLKQRINEIESTLVQHSPSSSFTPPSVQLPPIINKKLPFNWNEYKYNPDTNPTYIGINPYVNDTETINFYQGYTSLFLLMDKVRTHNCGPFAAVTIMAKDPGFRQLWKFVEDVSIKKIEKHLTETARNKDIPHDKISASIEESICVDSDSAMEIAFREKAVDKDGYNDLRLYGNVTRKTSSVRDGPKVSPKEAIATAATPIPISSPATASGRTSGRSTPIPVVADARQSQRMAMNKHAITLGLTLYEGKIDQELQLIEKITMILPKQKVIWILINKFFESIYPYMPFLDEQYFHQEMTRILGPEEYNDIYLDSLKVEKRLDFAYIGILLIVLRITYLSIFSNRNEVNQTNLTTIDPSMEAQEIKYLLLNPIDIDVISMAQICLDQFDIFHKCNLVILQCAFFMRLYQMFSPEDGDGFDGGDSQVFTGTVIQMAYSMGLNREPDQFLDVSNDERTNNIGRKIWLFLIIGDLIQGYQYGNPMSISEKSFDTKLPYYKPGTENVLNVELEKHVISTFAYFEKYYSKLKAILDVCIDIRGQVTMKQLTQLISDLEISLNDNYGLLKFFLVPFSQDNYPYPFVKAMKCKNYINMKMFLNTVIFHLYLYYENLSDIKFAFFYLKKLLANLCSEFIPNLFPLINDNYINFGPVADLFLNPTFQSMLHKCIQFISAILVRVNCTIYKLRYVERDNHDAQLWNNPAYRLQYAKLVKFSKILTRIMKFCIAAISRLSQRYYYAWILTKTHGFVGNIVIGSEFYKSTTLDDKLLLLDLNNEQLTELLNITETTLKKYTKDGNGGIFNEEIHVINEYAKACPPTPAPVPAQVPARASAPAPVQARAPTQAPPPLQHLNLTPSFRPSSVGSGTDEEFVCLQNEEIDKLWYQMAAMKQNPPMTNNNVAVQQNNSHTNDNNSMPNNGSGFDMTYPMFELPGMSLGDDQMDMFNGLTIDQLLKNDNIYNYI
ncbi:Multidrug resistance regulator 1 [Spathaspora sp. JA1]|nr:Multidrug resistance regulator 1 [Spathaspora sp. JA1]